MNRSGSQASQFEMIDRREIEDTTSKEEEEEEEEEVEEEEVEEEVEEEEEELVEEEVEDSEPGDEHAPEALQLPTSQPPNTTPAPTASVADEAQPDGVDKAPVADQKPSAGGQPGPEHAQSDQQASPEDPSFATLRALEAQVLDKLSTLQGGFKTAISQLGTSSTVTEATSNLTKLTSGWTAGLTNSMSWLTGSESAAASKVRALQLQTSKVGNELQTLFGLDDTEQLVESFKCKLLQTYACSHNSFTPAIQMAFQGTLHITDQHVCFGVEERGKQLPIKVPLKNITASSRQLPAQKGGSDVLKLELQAGKHVAFKDFESGGGALDSALALIEHLTVSDS